MASMRMIIVLALAALCVHARHHHDHGHGYQQEPEVIEVIEVDEIIIVESGNGTFEGSGFGSGNGSGIEGSGSGSTAGSGSGSGSEDGSGSGSGSGDESGSGSGNGADEAEDTGFFFRALNDTEESNCTALAKCSSDADCGPGKCIGAFVGTCECTKCLNFIFCKDDDACGGLQGACQNTTSTCSCLKGFKQAGFKTQFQANQEFCNKKSCTVDSADKDCFGLPCRTGICSCV